MKNKLYIMPKSFFQKIKTGENINKIKLIAFIATFLLIFYNFAFFVGQNAVDIPLWDEWDIFQEISQKGNWLHAILLQHNEHRIGVGLTVMKAASHFTDWSQIWETKFVSFQIILSCLILLFVKKRLNQDRKIEFLDILLPLVFLNTLQFGNILFAFQITFVFPLVFLCLSVGSLLIKNIRLRNLSVVIFSFLATFSSFHGLFVPISFIIFFIWEFITKRQSDIKLFLTTVFFESLAMATYFIGYQNHLQAKLSLIPDRKWLDFFAVFFSNGFFFFDRLPKSMFLQYLLSLSIIVFMFIGIHHLKKSRDRVSNSQIGLLLLIYTMIFGLSIIIGRSSFGIAQATETRYVTFSMLVPVGIFFIASDLKWENIIKICLIIILALNLIVFYSSANKAFVINDAAKRKEALKCYQETKRNKWNRCFKIVPLYPSEERLEKLMPEVLIFKKMNINQ